MTFLALIALFCSPGAEAASVFLTNDSARFGELAEVPETIVEALKKEGVELSNEPLASLRVSSLVCERTSGKKADVSCQFSQDGKATKIANPNSLFEALVEVSEHSSGVKFGNCKNDGAACKLSVGLVTCNVASMGEGAESIYSCGIMAEETSSSKFQAL